MSNTTVGHDAGLHDTATHGDSDSCAWCPAVPVIR